MRWDRFGIAGLVVAVALVLAACSSVERPYSIGASPTGPTAANGVPGGSPGGVTVNSGGGSSATAVSGEPNPASGSASHVSSGNYTSGSGTSPGAPGRSSGSSAVSPSGSGPSQGPAPGTNTATACRTPLTLGVSYSSDAAATSAAGGVNSAYVQSVANYAQNEKNLFQVGVDALNKRGGLGGCQVRLAWFDFSEESSESYAQQSQSECVQFAQDQHVFAVVPYFAETPDLLSCLAPYQIPVIFTGAVSTWGTTQQYSTGNLISPQMVANDRLGPDVNLWASTGYFTPGSKVGIMVLDDGTGVAQKLVNQYWEPALSRMHVPVVSTFTYPQITGFSSIGNEAQEMNNAVLQFREAGVDHVLFTPQTGQAFYFFTKDADAQGYHPRLALDSSDQIYVASSTIPAKSMVGAVAVSWQLADVAQQASVPNNPPDAARTACNSLYQADAAAVDVPVASLYSWCDVLNLLAAALSKSGGAPNWASLHTGVEGLGSSFQAASNFGPTRFGPKVDDGGTVVRLMGWDPRSAGWTYVSPFETIP